MTNQAPLQGKAGTLDSSVDLYVEIVQGDWGNLDEIEARVQQCATVVLNSFPSGGVPIELSIRLTNDEEIQQLNRDFRGQDKPTNVLSFPCYEADDLEEAYCRAGANGPPVMLGDVIITHGVTSRQASEQGKNLIDHLMHLVAHGILHLLGFDHVDQEDAEKMEMWERRILITLGIDDPYSIEA